MRFFSFFSFAILLFCTVQAQDIIESAPEPSQPSGTDVLAESEDGELIFDDEDLLKAAKTENKGEAKQKEMVVESEEELILDGGEEDLLEAARPKVVETIPDDTIKTDSSGILSKESSASETIIGSEDKNVIPMRSGRPGPSMPVVDKEPEPANARIENPQSINFARNLNEYRSPKLAMLLSLLVPGTGQAYARHSFKAGVFGATEVAIIGLGTAMGIVGKNAKKDARKFADQHYSADKFQSYYDELSRGVHLDTVKNIFLGLSAVEFANDARVKNESFYATIKDGDNPFIHGWKDVEPVFSQADADTKYVRYNEYLFYRKGSDSLSAQYGFSEYQKQFSDKISSSNSYYRVSKNVLTLLLVNHIISAIDAGITAKAHNDRLLKKESVWQNINIEQQYVTTGTGTATGYALQVRF